MSNLVFPVLPGLKWSTFRSPEFDNITKDTDSGRTFTRIKWSSPRWHYKRDYEFLRADANQELQTLAGFFLKHYGNGQTWLFDDPDDNTASDQQFGSGDGATAQFQLLRALGGFYEPVYEVNGIPSISVYDWQGRSLCSPLPRTNKLIYSEQLQQSGWNRGGCTVTADYASSPSGASSSADLLQETTGTTSHYLQQAGDMFDATLPVTASMYVKASGRTLLNVYMFDGPTTSYVRASFNLATGTVLGHQAIGLAAYLGASIAALPNGWYYVTLTGVPGSNTSPATKQIQVRMLNDSGEEAYTGDGTSGVLIWGAQVEQASSAGRYISTTNAQVTVTDYALGPLGLITFASTPVAGALLKWSGQYYWRCRFKKSMQEFEQFMSKLWSAKSFEFRTEKP